MSKRQHAACTYTHVNLYLFICVLACLYNYSIVFDDDQRSPMWRRATHSCNLFSSITSFTTTATSLLSPF